MPPEYQIVTYQPDMAADWDAYAARHADVTVYHTRAWAAVLSEVFGFREQSVVCMNGDRIAGILPLWQVNSRTLVNSPWRDRGGILVDSAEGGEFIRDHVESLPFETRIKGWDTRFGPGQAFLERYWINSVLDLQPGKDVVWKVINKNAGRNIRKAEQEGITVNQTLTAETLRHFYGLFKRTRKRLGVPIYPMRLFDSIAGHMPEHTRLYTAYTGDIPAASMMIFDMGATAVYAYGASDPAYLRLRPNDLLLWTAISDTLERGAARFDFGSDSPQQTELLRFKKKWGAVQMGMPTLHVTRDGNPRDTAGDDFTSPRYRYHRALLRHCPAWLLVMLGTFFTRRNG